MVKDDKVVRKDDWRKLLAMLWPMFSREKMTVRSGVLVFSVILPSASVTSAKMTKREKIRLRDNR